MILVHTTLEPSHRHGIGLFAAEFIPKGTVTWKYDPYFDTSFPESAIERMSLPAREKFMSYAYFDDDLKEYVLCFDDQRFINHCSTNWNILSTPQMDVAARDIGIGEELLCDYRAFEAAWFERRNRAPEMFK